VQATEIHLRQIDLNGRFERDTGEAKLNPGTCFCKIAKRFLQKSWVKRLIGGGAILCQIPNTSAVL